MDELTDTREDLKTLPNYWVEKTLRTASLIQNVWRLTEVRS